MRRRHVSHAVVKRAPVLAGIEAEAGVRYEDTRLARQARRGRRRLVGLLLAGAAGFAVEAVLQQSGAWLLGTLALALAAWRVHKGTLGGLLLVALAALFGALFLLVLLAGGAASVPQAITLVVVLVWGVAMLPDVVLLVRDAELQHAFGLWARRGDEAP